MKKHPPDQFRKMIDEIPTLAWSCLPDGSGEFLNKRWLDYTVPASTKIEAHTHRDDRIATVISGTWHIGYGSRFDEKNLKALTPGSFYTKPPTWPILPVLEI